MRQTITCPNCSSSTIVRDSRPMAGANVTMRRRECLNCRVRFTTFERIGETFHNNATVSGAINHLERALNSMKSLSAREGDDNSSERSTEIG